MAFERETKFPLKLFVDKERNHVVMAEAGGDLIGILFGLLKLPLGTIMCLQRKSMKSIAADENLDDQPNKIGSIREIGCINNLYQSVINLDADVFFAARFKNRFLFPCNPSEDLCQKLRLIVNDQELKREHLSCRHSEETRMNTGFINEKSMYLIFNDLKVLQSSPNNCVDQLVQLGYKNFNELTEMSINVGLKEMLDIVNQALFSESPLNDLFLMNGESKQTYVHSPKIKQKIKSEFEGRHFNCVMNLAVMVRKSKNEILYAEAEHDFVDFLCRVLTTPYASILELFGKKFVYQSVNELNSLGFTRPSRTPFACIRDLIISSNNIGGFVRSSSLFTVWNDLQVTPCGNTSGISFLQKLNVPLDDLQKHVVSIGETEALNLLWASLTTKEALSQGLSYLWKKPEEETKAGNLRFE
ncbi:uncharacterized protein LOC133311579 [Gastrolobium bilobum]|uniref:uncharacterized protein LOC133311579 n=1 Tax=Gastrolobium bilobum TaxID=150636 RepID=UPI002AAFED4C|nr:uncharacterized protein LOC133311579 [Gastrolobium bilobum]